MNRELIPEIRKVYRSQLKRVTQNDQEKLVKQLKHKFSELQEEEARLGRVVITGQINEDAYAQLRAEWNEKKIIVQRKIDELEFEATKYLDDLEVALVLMVNIPDLYESFEKQQRTNLLQMFVKRIIINREGEIFDHELHSPFEYLSALAGSLNGKSKEGRGSEQVRYGSLFSLLISLVMSKIRSHSFMDYWSLHTHPGYFLLHIFNRLDYHTKWTKLCG
jgi:hypothetical protein